jgi:pimeloyl-ACP methyl ester carboxylesterase
MKTIRAAAILERSHQSYGATMSSKCVEASDGTLVHFIDLDLHADALRTEVNDPVVLIHGLGCSWHHWSRQIDWIAHAPRVVAVDVRGGGGKTRWARPGWTTADMAADVHAVVSQVGLQRPAIVGCSMGGTIALRYALDYPGDLSRLVVLASFAGLPEEMAGSVSAQRTYIESHNLREIAA